MLGYPTLLPIDAAMILVNAGRYGLAPDGTNGDLACCVQAGWNILGYGLSIWKPHVHDMQAFVLPADEGDCLKALGALLEPATVATKQGTAAPDASALPWAQIIALAISLLERWLKK